MVKVHGLMVAGPSLEPKFRRYCGLKTDDHGRREGMFPGRYSEIFGRGERLGYILNLGHSFDAIEAYLQIY